MRNLFIRRRINKFISLLDSKNGTLSGDDLSLIQGKKDLQVISILEASGCIKVDRSWGGDISLIVTTHNGFSIYQLERHDIWMNRFYGFISGVAVTVIADIIRNVLL